MSNSPEFLRSSPTKVQRNRFVDLLLYLIPVSVALIGIFASSQYWAYLVDYDFNYTDIPFYITKRKFLWFEPGYPIFNPFDVFLIQLFNPGDPVVQKNITNALLPETIGGIISVIFFVIIGILRKKHAKNEHIYGTARWGNEKDLHKFGLDLQEGVILAQFRKAKVDFKVNPANSSTSLILKKNAPFVGHGGGTNTLMIAPTRSGKGVSSVL